MKIIDLEPRQQKIVQQGMKKMNIYRHNDSDLEDDLIFSLIDLERGLPIQNYQQEAINRAKLYNQQNDYERELNKAIQKSLEEQKLMGKSNEEERDTYESDLNKAILESIADQSPKRKNINVDDIDSEYQKVLERSKVEKFINSSMEEEKPIFPTRNSSDVKEKQNEEFSLFEAQECSKQEHLKMLDEQKVELEKFEKQKEEKQRKREKEKLEELRRKFKELPEEKSDGVQIAVTLPNQKRIVRKFGVDEKGENIFIWVSVNESLIKDEMFPIPFKLTRLMAPDLERDKTLEEQGIKRRILFQAEIEDE